MVRNIYFILFFENGVWLDGGTLEDAGSFRSWQQVCLASVRHILLLLRIAGCDRRFQFQIVVYDLEPGQARDTICGENLVQVMDEVLVSREKSGRPDFWVRVRYGIGSYMEWNGQSHKCRSPYLVLRIKICVLLSKVTKYEKEASMVAGWIKFW